MRKIIASLIIILVVVVSVFLATTAIAEYVSWTCPKCDQINWENYCSNCGQPAPSKNSGTKVFRYRKSDFSMIGNVVEFGNYEQDNYSPNGTERIEWIVLDVQEGKSLLLSKWGLAVKRYNEYRVRTTWENCTLRDWLNLKFYNQAFDRDEQEAIILSPVDNSYKEGERKWNTNGGKDTWDYLFLLSSAEAGRYFNALSNHNENSRARVAPTAYAKSQGAYTEGGYTTDDGRAAGWWWLRSPGSTQDQAARVARGGWIGYNHVDVGDGCVRPAMWINLDADIF